LLADALVQVRFCTRPIKNQNENLVKRAGGFALHNKRGPAHSPPRRGGVAVPPTKWREATEAAQTAWSDRHPTDFATLTTPVAASPR